MMIFKKKSDFDIDKFLKERMDKLYDETHKVCALCGITGHTKDMQPHSITMLTSGLTSGITSYNNYFNPTEYYHNGCYAEKFNKHLCPCKCGKWIDNKKSK